MAGNLKSMYVQMRKSDVLISILIIVFIGSITYLPLISSLGYYGDDWHVVWAGETQGIYKIFDEHIIDRPLEGLNTAVLFMILGENPIAWHLFTFGVRIAGALIFFLLVRLIFPKKTVVTTYMSILFLVYPGFLAQPTALSYQNHLIAYASGLLSIVLMIKALKAKNKLWRVFITFISMILSYESYLVMEWFIGLEGVRFIVIWYFEQRRVEKKILAVGIKSAQKYLPYLFSTGFYLFWRIFIFEGSRETTDVGFLAQKYISDPASMVARFSIEITKDFIETVFLAWGVPFYKLVSKSNYLDFIISIALALIAAAVLVMWWRGKHAGPDADDSNDEENNWAMGAVAVGAVSVLSTLIPLIIADRSVLFESTFDRFTLPSIFGTSIFVTAVLYRFLKRQHRFWLFCALIGISIITQYNNAAYYRNFWDHQRQLWWQLSWRAPDIRNDTVLLPLLPGKYRLADSYEIWGPANLIYHSQPGPMRIVGESINNETIFYIINEDSYGRVFRRTEFTIDLKNSLVMSIPNSTACLHLYDGQNLEISELEDHLIRLIAPKSHINLIQTDAVPKTPPESIFGKEPEHGWCYFYQKASLARQQKDWDEVVRLSEEASLQGLYPNDISEWMPFYEAFARSGQIDRANEIGAVIRERPNFVNPYCNNLDMDNFDFENSIDEYLVLNLCPNLFE